jgi:hypothetical protein
MELAFSGLAGARGLAHDARRLEVAAIADPDPRGDLHAIREARVAHETA